MFENTIQTNGTQSWKWVTISGRVFVDNDVLDQAVSGSEDQTTTEVFEELARDRLIEEVLPKTDEPFRFDSIEFPA